MFLDLLCFVSFIKKVLRGLVFVTVGTQVALGVLSLGRSVGDPLWLYGCACQSTGNHGSRVGGHGVFAARAPQSPPRTERLRAFSVPLGTSHV